MEGDFQEGDSGEKYREDGHFKPIKQAMQRSDKYKCTRKPKRKGFNRSKVGTTAQTTTNYTSENNCC